MHICLFILYKYYIRQWQENIFWEPESRGKVMVDMFEDFYFP